MTDTSSDADQPGQSFLSKLRQRSSIIFTIGLAISAASFLENLHMGKDAIAYVVNQFAQIQGLEDIVLAVAAIFHGALEWWREVLRGILSFLPFQVPQWLHDPLSLVSFGAARVIGAVNRKVAGIDDDLPDPWYRVSGDDESRDFIRLARYSTWSSRANQILLGYIAPLTALVVLDHSFYDVNAHRLDLSKQLSSMEVATYSAILSLLVITTLSLWRWSSSFRKLALAVMPRDADGNPAYKRQITRYEWR